MNKKTIKYAIYSLVAMSISASMAHARSDFQTPPSLSRGSTMKAPDAMQALRDAEMLREDAMARGDVELLKNLFSDYYYHVESNGRVRSKTQLLMAVQRGELKFLSYKVDEVEIRLNGFVAVAVGRFTVTREVGPDKIQYTGRFMRVWERHGNRWRNTMHQSTEVKPAVSALRNSVSTQ
jgi:hypothetical protein